MIGAFDHNNSNTNLTVTELWRIRQVSAYFQAKANSLDDDINSRAQLLYSSCFHFLQTWYGNSKYQSLSINDRFEDFK